MTSRLSSDSVIQMTPLLGSLARLISKGLQLDEDALRTLLLGLDLNAEPEVIREAGLWVQLLQKLHQQPSEALRQITVETFCKGLIIAAIADE